MRALLIAVALLACAGCGSKEFICASARECIDTNGAMGMCLQMHCAFRDQQCVSGFKWDDSAGPYANTCVGEELIPDARLPDARPTRDAP